MGNLIFLGFNSFKTHKRGVENVIYFQSQASKFDQNYYLYWDKNTSISKYENLICIGIKKDFFWFIRINLILFKLKIKNKQLFIHSHNPLMSIISLLQTDLFTVHDALYYLTGVNKHRLNKLFWLLEKMLYLRCKYVHFISEYAKKMSLYKGENSKIIYNTSHFEGYNLDNVFQDNKAVKFSNETYKVFIVRSIEERALINLIIEAANKLKTEEIQFFIAGKGPMLDFYRLQINNLGLENLKLLGYVSDNHLIQYYKNCDLVLVPAAYGEGFGLPIIEGYLFGKPVIASNVCAIPEVIISKNFLFENNSDSLISRIDYVKKNLKLDYKEYYSSKFSNNTVLSEMSELYYKLI